MEEKLEKPEIAGVVVAKARKYGMTNMFQQLVDDLSKKREKEPEFNIFTGSTGFEEFDKAMKDYSKKMEERMFYGTPGMDPITGPMTKHQRVMTIVAKMNEDELADVPPGERMEVLEEYLQSLPPGQRMHIQREAERQMHANKVQNPLESHRGAIYDEKLLQELRDFKIEDFKVEVGDDREQAFRLQQALLQEELMNKMKSTPKSLNLEGRLRPGAGLLEQIEEQGKMTTYEIGGHRITMKHNPIFDEPTQP